LEKRGSLSTETVALRIIDIVSIDDYPRRRASNQEPLWAPFWMSHLWAAWIRLVRVMYTFEHTRVRGLCRLLLEECEGGRGEQWRVEDVVVR
jgi:hypothetical protein